MTRMFRSYLIGCCLVALTAPAAAQLSKAAEDIAVLTESRYGLVAAHPDGGAVGAARWVPPGGVPRLVLRRVDLDANLLWSVDVVVPASATDPSYVAGLTTTVRGSTVVLLALQFNSEHWIYSFDDSGSLEWQTQVPPSAVTAPSMTVLGETDAGDLIAAGKVVGSGRLVVVRLDGTTGAEEWRFEAPSDANGRDVARMVVKDGEVFAAYRRNGVHSVERIDASGVSVFRTTGLFNGPNYVQNSLNHQLCVDDFGSVTVARSDNDRADAASLDPSGAVRWERPGTFSAKLGGVAALPAGDVALLAQVSGGAVQRIDATGQQVWFAPGPPAAMGMSSMSPDGSGGLYLSASATQLPTSEFLVAMDGNGAVTGTLQFAVGGTVVDRVLTSQQTLRGHTWFAVSAYESSAGMFERRLLLTRVVTDDLLESVTCTQTVPNSTGEFSRLRAVGDTLVAQNDVTLVADRLPPGVVTLFLTSTMSGFLAHPGGSLGDLCLGAPLDRYARMGELRTASVAGRASLTLDLLDTPAGSSSTVVTAGETRYFQAWHRDVIGASGVSNLTNAMSVTMQ